MSEKHNITGKERIESASDYLEKLLTCNVGVFLLLSDKQNNGSYLLIQHLEFSV